MKAVAVKYFTIFQTEVKHRITEKFDFMLNLAYLPLLVLVLYFVWSIVFQNQESIQGFSFNEMIAYAMIAVMLRKISQNSWVSSVIEKDITEGQVITFLCRPLSYLSFTLARRLARTFILALVIFPIIIIVLLVFKTETSILGFLLGLLLLAIAAVFTFLEFYCIGLLAFWFERVWGFKHAVDWFQELFSGTWFPITLLPLTIQNALFFLPFQYLVFTPASLIIGKAGILEGLQGIAILTIWSIVVFALSKIIWKKGLKKHDGKC